MIIPLGTTDFVLWLRCTVAGEPVTPDAPPAYAILDATTGAELLSGSFEGSDHDPGAGALTGLRKTGDLAISGANGFASGKRYRVEREFVASATEYAAPEYEFLVT